MTTYVFAGYCTDITKANMLRVNRKLYKVKDFIEFSGIYIVINTLARGENKFGAPLNSHVTTCTDNSVVLSRIKK